MEQTRRPSHPGKVLKGLYLEPLGLTISATAARLGISRKTLSTIVNGRGPVTIDVAMRLSRAFGTSPELWLNLQQGYDLWEAQQRENTWSDIQPFVTQPA